MSSGLAPAPGRDALEDLPTARLVGAQGGRVAALAGAVTGAVVATRLGGGLVEDPRSA